MQPWSLICLPANAKFSKESKLNALWPNGVALIFFFIEA